jgi:hypothetical protein
MRPEWISGGADFRLVTEAACMCVLSSVHKATTSAARAMW